jgi:Rieske 2Fe-2S family protein
MTETLKTSQLRSRPSRISSAKLAEIEALLARRREGFSLEAPFYTDTELFQFDAEAIFGQHWLFAASIAELPEPGDYVTVDYGPYSLIVLHNDEGGINVLHNVCRHRGARIMNQPSGTTGNLVCGYHSWTYSSEGELIYASTPGEMDFDKQCFALRRAHSRVVAGLIFVCLAEEPPEDFDQVSKIFEPYVAPHELTMTKVAYQQDLIENANWKLVMENNRECYHCDGHPELLCSYFPTYGLTEDLVPPHLEDAWQRSIEAEAMLKQRCQQYGLPYDVVEELDTRVAGMRVSREALDGKGESFSADGRRLSKKLLGDLPDFRLGRCSMHLQPNSWFHFLSDHAITFSVFPISVDQTLVRTTWLVADDAVERVDYDLEQLTHTWEQTNIQDRDLVELAQRGISSPAYEQGPYMRSEYQVEAFVNWYIQRAREYMT